MRSENGGDSCLDNTVMDEDPVEQPERVEPGERGGESTTGERDAATAAQQQQQQQQEPSASQNDGREEEEKEGRVVRYRDIDYGAESFYAIAQPVVLTMVFAALSVVLIRTEESQQEGEQALSETYKVRQGNADSDSAGEQLSTSVLNAIVIVTAICALTFVIVLLYKYNCIRFLYGYMIFASIVMLGFLSTVMFQLAIEKYKWQYFDRITFALLIYNFAVVGTASIFYGHGFPKYITQFYLMATSIIVAWQLSHFDSWTAWTLLVMLALYDLFAVLTPCGPLKALVNLMQRENAPQMPGLLYEANINTNHRNQTRRRRQRQRESRSSDRQQPARRDRGQEGQPSTAAGPSNDDDPRTAPSRTLMDGDNVGSAEANDETTTAAQAQHGSESQVATNVLSSNDRKQEKEGSDHDNGSSGTRRGLNEGEAIETVLSPSDDTVTVKADSASASNALDQNTNAEGESQALPSTETSDKLIVPVVKPPAGGSTTTEMNGHANQSADATFPTSHDSMPRDFNSIRPGDETTTTMPKPNAASRPETVKQPDMATAHNNVDDSLLSEGERDGNDTSAVREEEAQSAQRMNPSLLETHPTSRIPLALAILYRLPLVDNLRPIWMQQQENQDGGNDDRNLRYHFTAEELQAEVQVVYAQDSGCIRRHAVQNPNEETRYAVLNKEGEVRRLLFVNQDGRIFIDRQEENRARRQRQAEEEEEQERKTIRLGLGDFIFYSVLVSKAALYSFTTFASCLVVIVCGLGSTLGILALRGQALPALPISIFGGVAMYLLARYVVQDWVQEIFITRCYV